MPNRSFSLTLNSTAVTAFNWHLNNGAFLRLSPPHQRSEIIKDYVANDTIFSFYIYPFGLPLKWEALLQGMKGTEFCGVNYRRDCNEPCEFTDTAQKSVFKNWSHLHKFIPKDQGAELIDDLTYDTHIPVPFLGNEINRIFRYRHAVTKKDIELAALFGFASAKFSQMKIAVAGSTGFLGKQLVAFLTTQGHHVVRIRRGTNNELTAQSPHSIGKIEDYYLGKSPDHILNQCDLVINLAGENIAQKWTSRTKLKLKESRIDYGLRLIKLFAKNHPRMWINASAIGIYPENQECSDSQSFKPNNTFLAALTKEWEDSITESMRKTLPNTKLSLLRLGVIMHPSGGMLKKILPTHYLGMHFGSEAYTSWIDLNDAIYAIYHIINNFDDCTGAINLVSPNPIHQKDISKSLSEKIKIPGFKADFINNLGMSAILGNECTRETNLSMVVKPDRLLKSGFSFTYPLLNDSLDIWF